MKQCFVVSAERTRRPVQTRTLLVWMDGSLQYAEARALAEVQLSEGWVVTDLESIESYCETFAPGSVAELVDFRP